MLWLLMLAMPFPYIANEAGWVVAEVGRQPWIMKDAFLAGRSCHAARRRELNSAIQ